MKHTEFLVTTVTPMGESMNIDTFGKSTCTSYVVRYTGRGVQVERYTNGFNMELVKNFSGLGYEANLIAAKCHAREIAGTARVSVLP